MRKFWEWYERHYRLHVTIAAGLFVLQLLHLFWLTTHIVALRLLGTSYFNVSPTWQFLLVIIDYTEIPTLISVSLIYINELRTRWQWKSVLYLVFLNSQWLHLFWITDEVVAEILIGSVVVGLPVWLAWVAIGIDYLELPVIYDTVRRLIASWWHPQSLASVFSEQDK